MGGGGQHGGYDALDYRKIRHGDARRLGAYGDQFAWFLFEFHSHRFESLNLPCCLLADRSDFYVHGTLVDEKVRECLILKHQYVVYFWLPLVLYTHYINYTRYANYATYFFKIRNIECVKSISHVRHR